MGQNGPGFLRQIKSVMSSVKIIQRTDKKGKTDIAPLYIQVIIDRQRKLVATGISVPTSAWDSETQRIKRKYPQASSLQLKLDTQAEEIRHNIQRLEVMDLPISMDSVFGKEAKHITITIKGYFLELIEDFIKQGKVGTADKHRHCLNLLSQCNPVEVRFVAFTAAYVQRFIAYLKNKGNTPNSVLTKLSVLRAVYNKAVEEGIYMPRENPFKGINMKHRRPKKRAILKEDIQRIKELDIPENHDPASMGCANDLFLFSYYSAGINFTDIARLRYGNVHKDVVYYRRHKTGKDMMFPLTPANLPILHRYWVDGKDMDDYIFPILDKTRHQTDTQVFNRLHKVLAQVNKSLAQIAELAGIEKLTTYVARHTYATVMKRAGVNIAIISETMGHSDIKTTQIYLDSFEDTQIVEAMKNL